MICPYCGNDAVLVTDNVIYPYRRDLSDKYFWLCKPCDAYVGCHENSDEHKPLGRLANAELRRAKMSAHLTFDPLWKFGKMQRKEAYRWLADRLGIPVSRCHIGMFDVELCKKVVTICHSNSVKDGREDSKSLQASWADQVTDRP